MSMLALAEVNLHTEGDFNHEEYDIDNEKYPDACFLGKSHAVMPMNRNNGVIRLTFSTT